MKIARYVNASTWEIPCVVQIYACFPYIVDPTMATAAPTYYNRLQSIKEYGEFPAI